MQRFKANFALVAADLLLFLLFSLFIPGKNISNSAREKRTASSDIISCAPNPTRFSIDYNLEEVKINDNRKAAGQFRNSIYYINLEIREGNWYPETKEGTPIKAKAFAEIGKSLQVPGPLIRVQEGTEIKATVTNRMKESQYLQVNYGTGKDVSDETIADGRIPLEIKWLSDSWIKIPVYR